MLAKALISSVTPASSGRYWITTLGGTGTEDGYGIAVDSSGNVYIIGRTNTNSQTAGNYDMLIAKYNTSGTIQWQRRLGGTALDQGFGIAVDTSGNVYVTGSTASQTSGSNDILIAKYDTSGVLQWQRGLGGSGDDQGRGIAVDASGNVYIAAYGNSQSFGNYDIVIAKYDTSGVLQWQRGLGGTSVDQGFGIAVDASGNVYVAGQIYLTIPSQEIFIAKYNTSGTIQWQRSLSGSSTDQAYGIAVDASGNVYVAGRTTEGAGTYDGIIAKYNTSGTIQWQKFLGGVDDDRFYSVTVDADGNVYAIGSALSQGGGTYNAIIAKYNTSGVLQWQRSLGGTGNDYGYGIDINADGDICISGSTASAGAGLSDVFIAKLPSDGELTGTYGNLTYGISTLTNATGILTPTIPTMTEGARTLTDVARTLTDAATTLTSSKTPI